MPTYRVGAGNEEELCEVCLKNKYIILCDHANGSVIISSSNFKKLTGTCDKKLCRDCATRLWDECDLCPDHAEEVKRKLNTTIDEGKVLPSYPNGGRDDVIANKITLILAFKSMLYVARKKGLENEIGEKHLELENYLLNEYELDVTDLIDNLDNMYNALK